MMRLIAWLVLLSVPAMGANVYVRAGAGGSNNGSDWTNAYTSIQTAENNASRGDTIYVADGTYSETVTCNTAASANQVITIKKATEGDHGTETGWDSTYGDGTAEWDGVTFATDDWTIDGATGGGYSNSWSGHGFRIRALTNVQGKRLVFCSAAVDSITLNRIEFSFDANTASTPYPDSAMEKDMDGFYSLNNVTNLTVSRCNWLRCGRVAFLSRATWTDIVIEHCYILRPCHGNKDGQHSEIWSAQHTTTGDMSNVHFRWNFCEDYTSTGGLIISGADGFYVYGNIFHGEGGGNGTLAAFTSSGDATTNLYSVNNTFVNGDGRICVVGSFSGTNYAYNNLHVDNSGGNTHSVGGSVTATHNAGDVTTIGTTWQSVTTAIFTDYANEDWTLASGTDAGTDTTGTIPLSDTDMTGATRGSDGTWDRGAFEFQAGNARAASATVSGTLQVGP